jgi:prepilin-type N-terminal cleavage/methylation domain-containing protein
MRHVRHSNNAKAFTLIELLVVVSIIALLISILLPSLGRAKELANRVYCAANLSGITKSMVTYAQEQGDYYPAVPGPAAGTSYLTPLAASSATAATADAAVQSLYQTTAQQGSPEACLWVMVQNRNTPTPKIYLCKSDPYIAAPALTSDANGKYYDNFQRSDQLSYAIVYPWTSSGTVAPWWRDTLDSSLVVMSDLAPLAVAGSYNPAVTQGVASTMYNSPNHAGQGQNVSYGDAHVDWARTPRVGANNDNIFTLGGTVTTTTETAISAAGSLPYALPGVVPYDVIMVPVRNASNGSL